ncbi:MAG: DNA polymerase III subunit gamma/tau [Clostridia bacterium]|nr:MAG: DNA polymerase III subunit gamma/tau [Clostridia bacterium]
MAASKWYNYYGRKLWRLTMAYQALYRKYRPQLFADVLGQEHITTTLKNQVESGRVSHAYVFSGSRGTGKTTTAKILARAVNCAHPVNGEPCGECEYCLAAADSADIIELDAASNNGVDDVRAIIDKARFTPLKLKKKVYIIDEAHMLSRPAFNALLKTLEEPPEHVLFILATTEPQSIPATILSRCQRFDFHRIGVEDIISCVRSAVTKAGAEIDDEGLLVIARAAEGGMRDALSIADQCIAFCGNKVSARDIYGVLGGMDSSFLFTTADALINGDAALAVRSLDSVIEQGRDMGVFAADMAKHFRALLIAKLCGRSEDILSCTPDTMARYIEQASRCGETRLRSAVDALMDSVSGMRYLSLPRVRLESAFIRIASPDKAAEADANGLMERLEAMETKLAAIEKGGFTIAQPAAQVSAPAAEQTQTAEPRQTIAPQQAETAPAKPQPEAKLQQSNAKALWETVRRAIQIKNPTLAVLGMKCECQIEGDALFVRFPKRTIADAFMKPEMLKVAQDALSAAANGMSIRFGAAEMKNESVAETAKKAFGSMIEIVE